MNAALARIEFGLCFSEWMLGQGVTTDDFNAVYRPWLGRTDLAAQTEPAGARAATGGDAGQPAPDHVDPAADTAGAEWLGDNCRAVDRRVYGP